MSRARRSAPAGRLRPERWAGPVTSALLLLFVWAAVAHASGSGWVQALGALAAGVALVGLLAPALATNRLQVRIEASPDDATSGRPLRIKVRAESSCRLTPVRPAGTPTNLSAGKSTEVELLPDRRGLLRAIEVDLSSAAPFGLLWWSCRRHLALPRLVVVSPARAPSGRAGEEVAEPGSASPASRLAEEGERRGSREYQVGDSPRRVDWRSTAHTGSLMVKESDLSLERFVRLRAELPEEPLAAEEAASRLLAAICGHLAEGRPVVVELGEGALHPSRVTSERQAGRLLARVGKNPWGALGEEER